MPTESFNNNPKNVPALTGLRAICAYGIFFYHVNIFSKENNPRLFTFFDQFYSFIPFFFVISGFVIFYTYYKKKRLTKIDVFNYFLKRVARIFPVLIILNTVVFLLSYKDNLYSFFELMKQYLLNITLIKGLSSTYLLTGIGPSWTNTVEEVFYLLTPLIFILITRRRFLIKFIFIVYIFGFLITSYFIYNPLMGFLSSYTFTAYFTFFGRVFEFATGIYLAMLFMGENKNKWLEKYSSYTLYAGLFFLALSFTSQFYIATYYQVAHANEVWLGILVNNFMFPFAIFLILYHLLYRMSLLKKFLGSRLMVNLGNATYSFYLLHTTFVLSYIYKFISTNVFIAFIMMVLISYIFYRVVEQPVAMLLRKKLIKKTAYNKTST